MSLTGNVDFNNEKILTAVEVSKIFKVTYFAVHRWMLHGIKGVKLDAIRVGARLYTSEEALRKFVAESSGCASVPEIPTSQFKPKNKFRRMSSAEVKRQLKAAGL